MGSEQEAVFRCRHRSTGAIIGWRVNETAVEIFSDITPYSIRENGSIIYMLTIPVKSEYNETEVVCVALFYDGSQPEETPFVKLYIMEGKLEFIQGEKLTVACLPFAIIIIMREH